jgi:tRNA pseudouridine13 synthase
MNENYVIKAVPEDFIVVEESGKEKFSEGEYLVFRMKKTKYTTENAVQQIARTLGINRKNIGYAGSKDSQAITWQNITIKSVPKEKVDSISLKDIELTFLGKRKEPLSLGDLEFNSFDITIRKISRLPKKITHIVNYFGDQRFSINNSEVGLAIIKKNFKRAYELICEASDYDRDVLEAYVNENKNDFVGALKKIPWKTLNLYIHAYQSKLWNDAVTSYIAKTKASHTEKMPLLGFATEFDNDKIEEIYINIMQKEGITQADFVTRAIPDLSSAGSVRDIFTVVHDLEVGALEDDEINSGMKKCRVKFRLGKGSYATEVIKEMMK